MKTAMIVLAILTVAAGTLTVAGCATISSGTTQEMSFQSTPEDVIVTLIERVRVEGSDNQFEDKPRILGKTPFTTQLDRAENQSIQFSKPGYKPVTMKLTTTLNGWFWGNIVFGGLVGSTTDNMSGASVEYAPSQFYVTLTPLISSSIERFTGHSDRDKAREFIVRRYSNLMADLSNGKGEDLTTLFRLLRIEPDQDADARHKIQALSEVYTDPAVFANHVTELYLK